MGKLTAKAVAALTKAGMHGDGDGLWFQVKGATQRSWTMRYTSPTTGRAREMGLGAFPAVSLAQAREARDTARAIIRDGKDPIDVRDAANAPPDVARGMTFKMALEAYIKAQSPGWKDPKAERTWRNSVTTHAATLLDKHCREITMLDVLAVLEPIWTTKTTTATRLRERIEAVLDHAAAGTEWSDRANVARWKRNLEHRLVAPGKVHRVEGHASLPYGEAGAFLVALRTRKGVGARALELAILTGQRSGPIMQAQWPEFDLDQNIWRVPAEKMKVNVEHVVPLTPAMLRVLESMRPERREDQGDYVFPGSKPGKPISNMTMAKVLVLMGRDDLTVHGFRSTLRTWAGEETQHQSDVAEAVLAHMLPGGAVRAAYQRGALLDKRRALHLDWEAYIGA